MSFINIEDLSDPRLEPYRHLRVRNLTRFSGRFIAESQLLVERLLRSDYSIESILVDERHVEMVSDAPESVPVYVVPSKQISELLAFDFHRGVLACGYRKRFFQTASVFSDSLFPTWTGVMTVGVQDPENMGQILRTCSALGIRDLWIGPNCVDVYARRVLRVSMGTLLNLRLYEANDPVSDMEELRARGIRTVATTLGPGAIPLESYRRSGPLLVLLGNEANGLPMEIEQCADDRLKIDMSLGTDSLNVSIAAGIVLHFLTRLQS